MNTILEVAKKLVQDELNKVALKTGTTPRFIDGNDVETIFMTDSEINDFKADPPSNAKDFVYCGDFMFTSDEESNGLNTLLKVDSIESIDNIGDTINLHFSMSLNQTFVPYTMFNYLEKIPSQKQFVGFKIKLKPLIWSKMSLPSIGNGTGWTLNEGVYTHDSGTTAQQVNGLEFLEKRYRLKIEFFGITSGNVLIETDSQEIVTISADGIITQEFTGDPTDTTIFLTPTNDFDGSYSVATFIVEELV